MRRRPLRPSTINNNALTPKINALNALNALNNNISMNSPLSNVSNASLGPLEANVENIHIDPKVVFPDAYSHIVGVKSDIARVTQKIEALRPELKAAITAAQKLGTLNIGDKSFRGRNSPSVYVAHNTNLNDYVVRGDFSINGRPFRVMNKNSFNSVLAQMKQKKESAKVAIKSLSQTQRSVKESEELLARLRKDLDASTKKLRSNMRNYTAKKAKGMMRGLKPTTKVVTSSNVKTAQALLQAPKRSLWQRMTGRGRKTNTTRRNRS
jgi:vacuolar-type H+-ATPase subunit I/STV1